MGGGSIQSSPGARRARIHLRRMSPWLTAIGVFLVGQAAGGAVVGAVIGGVAHSSEEEHGLGPANYPWSHEGMMSSFDATS